jgi:hypothetical protein
MVNELEKLRRSPFGTKTAILSNISPVPKAPLWGCALYFVVTERVTPTCSLSSGLFNKRWCSKETPWEQILEVAKFSSKLLALKENFHSIALE